MVWFHRVKPAILIARPGVMQASKGGKELWRGHKKASQI
jgi:hypothetical protein